MSKAIAALLALMWITPVHAEEAALGRLFFTPEKRVILDRQRQSNILTGREADGAPLTFNGYVRRSGGRETQWINGIAQGDPTVSRRGLRVGETLDPGSGERQDLLQGGRIELRRAPPGRSP